MTVMTRLMFCLPGRTSRASTPMTAPKMMVPIQPPTPEGAHEAAMGSNSVIPNSDPARRARRNARHARPVRRAWRRGRPRRGQESSPVRAPAGGRRPAETGPSTPAATGRWPPSRGEADPALVGVADLHPADDAGRHEHGAPAVVDEAQHAPVGERGLDGRGDLRGGGVGLERQLASDVLDADGDLHRCTPFIRGRGPAALTGSG